MTEQNQQQREVRKSRLNSLDVPYTGLKYRNSKEYFVIYGLLVDAARRRKVLTYGELAPYVGLPPAGNHMGHVLGEILYATLYNEELQGRPMLTALVINAHGKAGDTFFSIARQLGKLNDDDPAAERAFWQAECQAVYAAWALA